MKGMSELVSAVLLMVLTVGIAVTIFSFFTQTVSTTTEKVENTSATATDCTSANINIEDVFISNGTAGSARVIVRNAGFTDLSITSAQFYNRTGYNFSAQGVPLGGFSKGSVANLNFANVSARSCPSDFSKVVVTTSCGGISDTFDGTPRCV